MMQGRPAHQSIGRRAACRAAAARHARARRQAQIKNGCNRSARAAGAPASSARCRGWTARPAPRSAARRARGPASRAPRPPPPPGPGFGPQADACCRRIAARTTRTRLVVREGSAAGLRGWRTRVPAGRACWRARRPLMLAPSVAIRSAAHAPDCATSLALNARQSPMTSGASSSLGDARGARKCCRCRCCCMVGGTRHAAEREMAPHVQRGGAPVCLLFMMPVAAASERRWSLFGQRALRNDDLEALATQNSYQPLRLGRQEACLGPEIMPAHAAGDWGGCEELQLSQSALADATASPLPGALLQGISPGCSEGASLDGYAGTRRIDGLGC